MINGLSRRGVRLLLIATLLLACAAGVALATIPGSNGVISACYDRKGALKVIDAEAGKQCGAQETALEWNQEGPRGATGPEGATGPSGKAALAGETCPAGQFVTGFDAQGDIACAAGGSDPGVVTVQPAGLYFGEAVVGGSEFESVSFTNVGDLPIDVVGSTSRSEFEIVGTNCSTLAAGQTCAMAVIFRPLAARPVAGTLSAGGAEISLVGIGVE